MTSSLSFLFVFSPPPSFLFCLILDSLLFQSNSIIFHCRCHGLAESTNYKKDKKHTFLPHSSLSVVMVVRFCVKWLLTLCSLSFVVVHTNDFGTGKNLFQECFCRLMGKKKKDRNTSRPVKGSSSASDDDPPHAGDSSGYKNIIQQW